MAAIPFPQLAKALLPHALAAVATKIKNTRAIDAAILSALVGAVDYHRPRECVAAEAAELPAPELVGYVAVPWTNATALALADAIVGAFDKPAHEGDLQGLARTLTERWATFSGGGQVAPLADPQWRAKVAVRTIDLLPLMLAKTVPDAAPAERFFNLLIASKTTDLGAELKARTDVVDPSDEGSELPVHPPHTVQWRSDHVPCTFEIAPRFDNPKSTYWQKLADVRVEVAEHTGTKAPYLIPSFAAPFVLRTPGWFKANLPDFDQKKHLTAEFCQANMHRKLRGYLFTMISIKNGPLPRIYCTPYDDYLTNGYLGP